jgi:hypothetical protein
METRDYSKFKFLKANRDIRPLIVKDIVESIKTWGIIPGRPVLVDGDYNIIDGQHRFIAIRSLGHPVPYEVLAGNVIAKTMALNANQAQWKLIDYIQSYSEQGVDCYRKFLKFEDKYKLGVSSSLLLCFGLKSIARDIRKGVEMKFIDEAEGIATFINSIENVSYKKSKTFVAAVSILYLKANDQQLKLVKANILKIPQFSNVIDYTIAFENIINHRKRGDNKIILQRS